MLQAPSWHVLIHKKPLFVLQAVPDKFHKIRVGQLPKVIDLSLQSDSRPKLKWHTSQNGCNRSGGAPTSHSLCPWKLSSLSFFTATIIPVPGFTGASVRSSIHPLKTEPKPPSPSKLSDLKFLVEPFSSLKVNFRTFDDSRISVSVRGVGGTDDEEPDVLVPKVLESVAFLLLFLEPVPGL